MTFNKFVTLIASCVAGAIFNYQGAASFGDFMLVLIFSWLVLHEPEHKPKIDD